MLDSYTFCFKRWHFRLSRMLQLAFENGSCEINASVYSLRVEFSLCASSCWELSFSGKQNPSHVDKSVVKIVIHNFTPNVLGEKCFEIRMLVLGPDIAKR